jgi:hypothetical protein
MKLNDPTWKQPPLTQKSNNSQQYLKSDFFYIIESFTVFIEKLLVELDDKAGTYKM